MKATLETGKSRLADNRAPVRRNRVLAKVVQLVKHWGGDDRCGKGVVGKSLAQCFPEPTTMTSPSAMITTWGIIELPPCHSLVGLSW